MIKLSLDLKRKQKKNMMHILKKQVLQLHVISLGSQPKFISPIGKKQLITLMIKCCKYSVNLLILVFLLTAFSPMTVRVDPTIRMLLTGQTLFFSHYVAQSLVKISIDK